MRELARSAGVDKAKLSLIEAGRLIPTGEEFDLVMAVLDRAAVVQAATISGVAVDVPPTVTAAPPT